MEDVTNFVSHQWTIRQHPQVKRDTSTSTSMSTVSHENKAIGRSIFDLGRRKRPRYAFAITITSDGPFQDGAAVLAYSIVRVSENKNYDVSLVAFVHPTVTTTRPILTRLGFHVIEVPTPINASAIKFKWFREHIDKNGCCGSSELIKLNSYRLEQYDKVIHMDADTFVLNPIDEVLKKDISLVYTTDPNMASHEGEDKMPAQGGFLVMKPSTEDFLGIINIMLSTDFRQGSAWNGTKIGWYWGGMTVQGVLPYYYNRITAANRSVKVDRCLYNTMADTPECEVQTLDEIKSAHFTVCQKPWGCWKDHSNRLCGELHKKWFELRKGAEKFYSIPVNENPCPKGGHKAYQLMDISCAVPPKVDFLVPDESPDRLLPIGNSGYDKDVSWEPGSPALKIGLKQPTDKELRDRAKKLAKEKKKG